MGEKGQKTKELILEKAYGLFAQNGFKQVTMKDICEATGLSRGGLYRHYSGTDVIFSEILSREYVISDQIEHRISAITILDELLEAIRDEMMDQKSSLSLAIYEYASMGNEQFFEELNESARKRWISLIEYGIKRGEFKKVNPLQITDLILYSYQGVRMWSRIVSLGEKTADNIVRIIRQLLVKEENYELLYGRHIY